jgi:hypothetical protein
MVAKVVPMEQQNSLAAFHVNYLLNLGNFRYDSINLFSILQLKIVGI